MKAIRAKEHGWDPPGEQPFENVGHAKLKKMAHEGIRKKKKSGMRGSNAADALQGYRRGR
jgi:hypothetical protein